MELIGVALFAFVCMWAGMGLSLLANTSKRKTERCAAYCYTQKVDIVMWLNDYFDEGWEAKHLIPTIYQGDVEGYTVLFERTVTVNKKS